ncbi:MAG: S41 family peptidase, partial [Gemmatimonadales bacterium]
KVAFSVRGTIFAASSHDGGVGQRVSTSGLVQEQPAWAPDSRRLAFTDDRDGTFHIYLYDFVLHQERRLTTGDANDVSPVWSPDGNSLAYVRGGDEIHVLALGAHAVAGGSPLEDRVVAHAFLDRAPFLAERALVWSPDGRWLAFATSEGNKLFANSYLVSAAGGEARPVSWMSNTNADALEWSPDGTFLLMVTSQRTEPGAVARIDLVPRTPRFREDQFRDLFTPEAPTTPAERRSQPAPSRVEKTVTRDTSRGPARDSAGDTTHTAARDSTAHAADSAHRTAERHTNVVFDGLRSRLSLLPIGLDVVSEVLAPDGKSVAVTAIAADQANIYVFPLDELSKEEPVARQLTSTPGQKSSVQWSSDGKEIYYLESGHIAAVSVESRAVRPVPVRADVDVDSSADRAELFTLIWRELRENFFDAHMNGVDWNAVHAEYAPFVQGSQTSDEFVRLMNEMVGELNASHSGVRGAGTLAPYTGRLGVRWDGPEYERSGKLRVAEIIPLGPAALAGKIAVGDWVTAINGSPIEAHTNVDELLGYRIGRQTTVHVVPASAGDARDVTMLPVSTNTEKGLLYRAWVEQQRAYVSKISGGRLGYVHMFDMGEESLHKLYADLDAQNQASEGVVIDIRNNNGGFVNAYALDVLTRAPYLTMQVRGTPAGPARTLLGQRALELPTVLVTNMHSLSDAEDFSEGYRTMKLGKIVGTPTAGWIIYTSNDVLFDGSSVRIPFVRIRGADNSDMELHPRPVDVPVVRQMGESYAGHDSQLDAAVKTLLEQIGHARVHAGAP